MTPRPPRGRTGARALAAGSAVALSLGLGACSALGDPRAAAVVDGRVVTQADVQAAVTEIPVEITGGVQVDPSQVLGLLVVQDVVEDVAREFTGVATEVEALEYLREVDAEAGREPGQYSEATLQLIATQLMFTNIQQTDLARPAIQEGLEELVASGVEINPRYGRVSDDGELLLGSFQHDWLPEAAPGA